MRRENSRTYYFKNSGDNRRYILTLNGTPLKEANRFLGVIETRGLSLQTTRAYGFDLLYLFRWLDETGRVFDDLTQLDLLDFIQHQKDKGARPRSINSDYVRKRYRNS